MKKSAPSIPKTVSRLNPLNIILIYIIFYISWILVTDLLVNQVIDNHDLFTLISMIKGYVSVFLAALLLYGLFKRAYTGIISANKELEEKTKQLIEREDWFRELFEKSLDAIGVVQKDAFVFVNPAFPSLFGFESADDFVKKQVVEVIAPECHADILSKIEKRERGEDAPLQYVTIGLRKDNSKFDLEVHVSRFSLSGIFYSMVILRDITERKIAEQKLIESENRFRELIDNAPVAIAVHQDGFIKIVNDAGVRLFRAQSAEQVIGSKVLDRVHPDSLPNVVNRIRGVLTEGLHAPPLDEKLIRFDGSVIDAEVTSSPVFLDGRPAAQLVLIDISERKQAQEALRRSEQRLLSTLENTPNVAIQWYDENGKILYWNRASESFYGYQSSEALGKTLDQLIHTPEEAAEFLQILQSIRETGKPYGPYEAHIHRHDGSAGWVLATVFEIPGGEGNSVFVCMDADITEQKRAEEELRLSQQNWEGIFQGLTHPTVILDKDHQILEMNESLRKKLRKDIAELREYKCWEIFHGAETLCPPTGCPFEQMVAGGKAATFEMEMEAFGGYYIVSCTPLLDSDGNLDKVIHIATDITDRKRAEESLRQSNDLLSLFIKNSPIFTYIKEVTQTESRVIYASENFKDMIGISRENMLGKTMEELFPLEFAKKMSADDWAVVSDGRELVLDEELNNRSYITYKFPITLSGKRMLAGYTIDITERKQTEAVIRESEEKYRALVENAADSIFMIDKNYSVLSVNKYAAALFRKPQQEIIGMSIFELFPPAMAKQYAEKLKEVFESGVYKAGEASMVALGKEYWVSAVLSPIKDEKGDVTAIIGVTRDITENKLAEAAIRESEEKYRALVENAADAIFLINKNFTVLSLNKHAAGLFRKQPAEIIGTSIFDLFPETLADQYAKNLNEVFETGVPVTHESKFVAGENEFWISTTLSPIKDAKGNVIAVIGMARDISERKQGEIELRRQRDLNQLYLDTVQTIIVALDTRGHISLVNSFACQLLGYAELELIDQPWFEMCLPQPEGKEIVYPVFLQILSGNIAQLEYYENKVLCRDGSTRLIGWHNSLLKADGRIIGTLSSGQDITEQKKAEVIQKIQYNIAQSILKAEDSEVLLEIIRDELNKILDTTNFFVALYNPEKDTLRKIIFRDEKDDFSEWPAKISISGYVVKTGRTQLMRTEDIEAFSREHNIELIGTKAACWLGLPISIQNQVAGAMVIQSYTNRSAYNPSDITLLETVAQMIGIFLERQKNLEELIVAKDKAEEMSRLKSSFLANMSHELRTPLIGIIGFADFLMEELEEATFRDMAEKIYKAGIRLSETINLILDISKFESEKMDFRSEHIDIVAATKEITELFSQAAEKKGLSLNSSFSHSSVIINIDERAYRSIMNNLINNALKFTSEGGVSVGIKCIDLTVEIRVSDTGIGIADDHHEIIFDEFRQVSEGYSRNFEGTGLGLNITKKLVEKFGGTICVESVHGAGSTFIIRFPIISELPSAEKPAEEKTRRSRSKRSAVKAVPRILLVDDDPFVYDLLKRYIGDRVNLESTPDGEFALKLCKDKKYDLIFMDINLRRGLDGVQITKQIREMKEYSRIPIVAITAYAMKEDKEEFLAAGCSHYLAKPFNRKEIIDLIDDIMI